MNTEQEKNYFKFLMMPQEERNQIFDTGIFNDIVESYIMEYLQATGNPTPKNEIHETMKSIFDTYDAYNITIKNK